MYTTAANTDLIRQFDSMNFDGEKHEMELTTIKANETLIEIVDGSNKHPDYLFPTVSSKLTNMMYFAQDHFEDFKEGKNTCE